MDESPRHYRAWDPGSIGVAEETRDLLAPLVTGAGELDELVRSLATPQGEYHLRVVPWNVPDLGQFWEDIEVAAPGAHRHSKFPEILCLPTHGPNAVPKHNKVVRLKEGAAEKVLIGADLFVPGVDKSSLPKLRRGDLVQLVSARTNFVVGAGEAAMDGATVGNSKSGVAVWTRNSVFETFPFRGSRQFAEGQVFDQSLPSYLAARVAAAEYSPGERVADLCAAPGGKTTAFAQAVHEAWGEFPRVLALDRSANRCRALRGNLERLRLVGVEVVARELGRFVSENPRLHESFDIVTLDPPCSGLGNRPRLSVSVDAGEVLSLARNQNRLLNLADRLLKPGGSLVYSTCTITLEENEGTVARLLSRGGYEVEETDLPVGRGGFGFNGGEAHLSSRVAGKFARFHPNLEDTTGFFIAKLRKLGKA
ncbi:MAG: PUA domain-containing protein [Promethearchaeota archaeon]